MSKIIKQDGWCSYGRRVWKAIAGKRQSFTPTQALTAIRAYARKKASRATYVEQAIEHLVWNGYLPKNWRKAVSRVAPRLVYSVNFERNSRKDAIYPLVSGFANKNPEMLLVALCSLAPSHVWRDLMFSLNPPAPPSI